LLVHLQHLLREEGQQVVQHVRTLLLDYKVASRVFGKAGVHLGQEFNEFAVKVELLAASGGRARARG